MATAIPDKPVSILVVDDDPKIVFVVGEFLEMSGFCVIPCNGGKEALAIIGERDIDLVLLDIMMPDIDGLTVAKSMRLFFGKDNFVPIIMLTALTKTNEKIAGLENADDYISKPFSLEELLARVKVMLRIRSLHHDLFVSKNRFQFLYENVPYMYVTIDNTGSIVNCNTVFCRKNDNAKEDLVGRNIESFFRREDQAALKAFIRSEQPPFRQDQLPLLIMTPLSGTPGPLWVRLGKVDMGQFMQERQVEIIMQDITYNIKLEQEQRDARRQLYLSARLASIGTLAAGVAHQLNNPLTAILGCSGALLGRLKTSEKIDEEEFKQYLTIINTESLRCRDIIANLSVFARETEVRITSFALKDCVAGTLQLLSARANKKSITITSDIPSSIIVKADPQKMKQVMINVITNCIDFCAPGCLVAITASTNDHHIRISVMDNGPGISSQIVPKVFDPFFTTKKTGHGAGLGLAISHYILEEFNGAIDIESEPGKGTNVIIEIPKG